MLLGHMGSNKIQAYETAGTNYPWIIATTLLACEIISKWDKHMMWNKLRVCYIWNMVKLFMKECVWHPLYCQWTAYQFSSSLSHLCHFIFIPIKPPFHISFLSLRCLSLSLFPLFVFLSVSYSLYILLLISLSLWFIFFTASFCFI